MWLYGGSAAGKLVYLGSITATATNPVETSVGTLSIAAGTLLANDKLLYIIATDTNNDPITGTFRVRTTINSVNIDWATAAAATTFFHAVQYLQESPRANTYAATQVNGIIGASTNLVRAASTDTSIANPMTKAITVNALAAAGANSGTMGVKVDVYRVVGS